MILYRKIMGEKKKHSTSDHNTAVRNESCGVINFTKKGRLVQDTLLL